jgi:hypothetical protein
MPNYLHVYNLFQLVHYPFPHQPSMLVVSFLYVGCTHYQFNFHTTNEMNLRTHKKLIKICFIFEFKHKINGSLFFRGGARMSLTTKV